jgi:divalent metal cation (Fe/Co/Zn/Cd) transporter
MLQLAFFLVILVFGIILTRMSLKFVFQEFQPLRKRINFPVMALSSIVSIILITKNYLESKKKDSGCLIPNDQQPG